MSEEDTERINLFDGEQIEEAIHAIAQRISKYFTKEQLMNSELIGIQSGGVPLARKISKIIKEKTGIDIEVGSLDITMYRDDFGTRPTLPVIRETSIPFDINGKIIILTDDVLQSGRSIRAALDALTDYGRPGQIRLAALVDRGMREYPIHADFVGETISVEPEYRVCMDWPEYSVYKTKR